MIVLCWSLGEFGPTSVILLSHLKLVCLQQRVKTDSHFSSHSVSSGLHSFDCLAFRLPCVICCCCHCSNSCSKAHCLTSHRHLLKLDIKTKCMKSLWVQLFLFQELVISRWCSCRGSPFSCRPTPTTHRCLLHWPQPGVSMKLVVSRFSWDKKLTVQVGDWLRYQCWEWEWRAILALILKREFKTRNTVGLIDKVLQQDM